MLTGTACLRRRRRGGHARPRCCAPSRTGRRCRPDVPPAGSDAAARLPREGSPPADCGHLGGAVRAAPSGDVAAPPVGRPVGRVGRHVRDGRARRCALHRPRADGRRSCRRRGRVVRHAPVRLRSSARRSPRPGGCVNASGIDRDVAITPDGSRVVYRGNNQLLVRALNQLEPTVLSGLGAPQGVFISPDGQWVGFFDGVSHVKKVAITGGPPVTVCADGKACPRGATWGPDGTIIFATTSPATGLQRVSAAGGEPTVLTKPDRERGEGDHLWPEFLPGGKAVLFTITPATGGIENAQIAVLDLRTGTSKVLIRGGSHAHYVPTGHLVYGVVGDVARRGIRPRTAGGGRDACAGAGGRGDDRPRAPLTSRWPPTARSSTSQARPVAVAGRPSCRWIARDVPHRCLASRPTRTATCACRPMGHGSRSPPRTMSGSTISLAPR